MPSGVLSKLNFGFRRVIVARNSASLLSSTTQFSSRRSLFRNSMAASSAKAVFGDVHIDEMIATCGNGLDSSKPSGVFFADRTRTSCLKASLKIRNRELPNSRLVCGYFMFGAVQRNCNSNNLVLGPLLKNFYSSSSVCFSAGPASNVSLDGNSNEDQLVDSTMVSDQYVISSSVCFGYLLYLVTHFRVLMALQSNYCTVVQVLLMFSLTCNGLGSNEERWFSHIIIDVANEIGVYKMNCAYHLFS